MQRYKKKQYVCTNLKNFFKLFNALKMNILREVWGETSRQNKFQNKFLRQKMEGFCPNGRKIQFFFPFFPFFFPSFSLLFSFLFFHFSWAHFKLLQEIFSTQMTQIQQIFADFFKHLDWMFKEICVNPDNLRHLRA